MLPFPRGGDDLEWRSPVSDPFTYSTNSIGEPTGVTMAGAVPNHVDEERPPSCPTCNRRLVILATHWQRDTEGISVRKQLWGCPRGHATAYRSGGHFSAIEMLPDAAG